MVVLVGWGCVGGGGGKCGTGVRASISKPAPFIYLAFEKKGPIHILDRSKCRNIYLFIYCL